MDRIAEVLHARSELDGALRIRRDDLQGRDDDASLARSLLDQGKFAEAQSWLERAVKEKHNRTVSGGSRDRARQ